MVVSDQFIRFMGYETEGDLYTASTLIVQEGPDIGWYVTPRLNVTPAQWVAWDDADPGDPGYTLHRTREEAVASHWEATEGMQGVTIKESHAFSSIRSSNSPRANAKASDVKKRAPKETLPVRFPPAMIAEIRAVAAAQDLLPSELVREAVRRYLVEATKDARD